MACLIVLGCQTPPVTDGPPSLDVSAFLEQQKERAALLRTLKSGGTIELREQAEDGGSSFQDCALELWRDGDRFALRLRKLGERFLWVGSDSEQWWLFELAADPVRLVVLPDGIDGSRTIPADLMVFGPDQLLHLAGLEPIAFDPATCTTSFDEALQLARVECPAPAATPDWSRLAWLIDIETKLPRCIMVLDDAGAVRLESWLSGYEPIRARDQPLGNWPAFPRKVHVKDASGDLDVHLFFNRPIASNAGFREALFDLARLMKTFKPGVVEYVQP